MSGSDLFLGLPSLSVKEVNETWDSVSVTTSLVAVPPCPRCQRDGRPIGHLPPLRVIDTPSRGKPTFIDVVRPRLICDGCAKTYSPRGPDLAPRFALTRRAQRHIERQAIRKPSSLVAEEMGMGARNDRQVRDIARDLADRLASHRFPTPDVIGVDDLSLNGNDFSVITDGRTGHALGVVSSKSSDAVRAWIRRGHANGDGRPGIDLSRVKVLVTDLGSQNLSLGKSPFGHTLHVADKWHVMQVATKIVGKVIRTTLSELDQAGAKEREQKGRGKKTRASASVSDRKADAIRAAKRDLLLTRENRRQPLQLSMFDELPDRVRPVLDAHPAVSKAYWGRWHLAKMYRSTSIKEAIGHAMQFARRMLDPELAPTARESLKFLFTHRRIVLNYFRALTIDMAGVAAGVTNGPTERRNQNIRKIWEGSRGLSLPMLNLRAVYEPWMLDVDIIECGGCGSIHGPFGGDKDARRRMPIVDPANIRCRDCDLDSSIAAVPAGVVRVLVVGLSP